MHQTDNRTTAYYRDPGSLRHLYLIVSVVVRIVRLGFCRGSDSPAKEEAALCSEAFNKDALILGGGLLSI
jgi:hypothetical protein